MRAGPALVWTTRLRVPPAVDLAWIMAAAVVPYWLGVYVAVAIPCGVGCALRWPSGVAVLPFYVIGLGALGVVSNLAGSAMPVATGVLLALVTLCRTVTPEAHAHWRVVVDGGLDPAPAA